MNGHDRSLSTLPRPQVLPAAPQIRWYPYQDPGPTEGSQHFHWTIQAFQEIDRDGNMSDVSIVIVEAPGEALAIERAMTILPYRKGYRIASVTENCSLDEAIRKEKA
jgi:hypothetical protein